MPPEVKDALKRISLIRNDDDGYCNAVLDVYACLPKGQLYHDAALVREYLKTLED